MELKLTSLEMEINCAQNECKLNALALGYGLEKSLAFLLSQSIFLHFLSSCFHVDQCEVTVILCDKS